MVPVDLPQYRGFDLMEKESVKTPKLRKVAENLERTDIEVTFNCYQVIIYGREETSSTPASKAEMIVVPKANQARIAHGKQCDGIDCSSPEEAVHTWLEHQTTRKITEPDR